jgi:hypothetical protein
MAEAAEGKPDESRFDLQLMLKELEAENARQVQGPVKQSDILKMFQNRKQRDGDGQG